MEFAIGLGIGAVIALVFGKRKKRKTQPKSSSSPAIEREQLKKADEELITVILPTINHDK
jgi:hypothetical protein